MSVSSNSLRAIPSSSNQGQLPSDAPVSNNMNVNDPHKQTPPLHSGNPQVNTWFFLMSLLGESNQYLVSIVFIAIGITILLYGPRAYKETAVLFAYVLGCYLVVSQCLELVGHEATSLPGLILTNIGGLCGVVFVYALSNIFVFTYLMGLSAVFFGEVLEAANILKDGVSNNVITVISLLFGFLLSLLFMQLRMELNISIIFSSIGALITAESFVYFLNGSGDKWTNGICCVSNKFSKTGCIDGLNCHLLYTIWGLIACLGTIVNLARVVTVDKIHVSSMRDPLIEKKNLCNDGRCSILSSVKGVADKTKNYIINILPGANRTNEITQRKSSSEEYKITQDANNDRNSKI